MSAFIHLLPFVVIIKEMERRLRVILIPDKIETTQRAQINCSLTGNYSDQSIFVEFNGVLIT
jgi:hypothetical protein